VERWKWLKPLINNFRINWATEWTADKGSADAGGFESERGATGRPVFKHKKMNFELEEVNEDAQLSLSSRSSSGWKETFSGWRQMASRKSVVWHRQISKSRDGRSGKSSGTHKDAVERESCSCHGGYCVMDVKFSKGLVFIRAEDGKKSQAPAAVIRRSDLQSSTKTINYEDRPFFGRRGKYQMRRALGHSGNRIYSVHYWARICWFSSPTKRKRIKSSVVPNHQWFKSKMI
jgi:hypothetical protein